MLKQLHELRIGSLIGFSVSNGPETVSGSGKVTAIVDNQNVRLGDGVLVPLVFCFGLALDSRQLEMAGFHHNGSKSNPYFYQSPSSGGLFSMQKAEAREDEYKVWWNNQTCFFVPLIHIHQLQNLFLSLTGAELNIPL